MVIPISNLTAICTRLPVRYINCKDPRSEVTKPASLLKSFRQDQSSIFVTCEPTVATVILVQPECLN